MNDRTKRLIEASFRAIHRKPDAGENLHEYDANGKVDLNILVEAIQDELRRTGGI